MYWYGLWWGGIVCWGGGIWLRGGATGAVALRSRTRKPIARGKPSVAARASQACVNAASSNTAQSAGGLRGLSARRDRRVWFDEAWQFWADRLGVWRGGGFSWVPSRSPPHQA